MKERVQKTVQTENIANKLFGTRKKHDEFQRNLS